MSISQISQADVLSPGLWQDKDPRASDLAEDVLECVRRGQEFLFSTQREDLFWCAELESNPTITSEYVFLYQMLGLELTKRREKIIRYLSGQQKEDGSWGIAMTSSGDVSTTAETYLALRILGLSESEPVLIKAEEYILQQGGLENVRIFTRIFFAMFGLIPWKAIPALPPEFVLLPPQAAVNIYSLASWARGTMIPLFVIFHHKPVFALPNGRSSANDWLDHLWLNKHDKEVPYMPNWWQLLKQKGISYETLFGSADRAFKFYDPLCIPGLRKRAIDKCMAYILEHQEASGDWGGIFPPMINGVLALVLQGYAPSSEPVKKGLQAIESFGWEDEKGYRIQACVSPVWDTALSLVSLRDSGVSPKDPRMNGAATWLLKKQIRGDRGDWRVYRPNLIGGGWSFEYHNTCYPDLDDTAAVLLSLLKMNPENVHHGSVLRAIEWLMGMQNNDGGWAAFDVGNDKLYLNKIPFSDMNSLCDTSCPDITGRVLESFGYYLKELDNLKETRADNELKRRMWASCEKGIAHLRRTQEADGSWFGRWGVNYVYGTSNALCGLSQMQMSEDDPMISRALAWMRSVQNSDGGWGESLASYDVGSFVAHRSTPSQTAWALMGLLAFDSPQSETILRGIAWLVDNQVSAPAEIAYEGDKPLPVAHGATWIESESTGTGFPQRFYLRYHLYRHYFPMMALGRYLQARVN